MSLNKDNIKKISIALAAVITVSAIGFAVSKSGNTDGTETANSSLVAGASSEMNSAATSNTSVTAGATSDLYNDAKASVSAEESDLVSVSEDELAEQELINSYNKLGVADITEGNLNIREKASAESSIVGKMTKHNACDILEEDGEWYKIKSGKVTGYVKAEYIATGDNALEIAKSEIMTIATVEGTATLRVRAEATQDSKTRALVGEGEDIDVVVSEDGNDDFSEWVHVEVDDEEGYVSSEYVKISKKLPCAKTITEIKYGAGISDVRVALVQYALQFVGNRYVWGGTSLTNGVDCSGFTMQVYRKFGISLPHHSGSQPAYGVKITAAEAQPGDLFFYGSGRSIGHVGIYIGNGQLVHASNKRDGIKISNAFYRTPVCIVRYFN